MTPAKGYWIDRPEPGSLPTFFWLQSQELNLKPRGMNPRCYHYTTLPYRAYLDRGWFEVVQYPVYIDGEVVLKFTPYITPQGQKGLAKIVKRYYTAA